MSKIVGVSNGNILVEYDEGDLEKLIRRNGVKENDVLYINKPVKAKDWKVGEGRMTDESSH